MTNAMRILLALDSKLRERVELTLYGRAALVLGFSPGPREASVSRDVDAVLQLGQAEALNESTSFWEAVEAVNLELAGEDLFISHFFVEDQVILTPHWIENRKPIAGPWRQLNLFRLGNGDLLLSKLMRDDPLDHQDSLFIVRAAGLSVLEIERLAGVARFPASSEIREQFEKAGK